VKAGAGRAHDIGETVVKTGEMIQRGADVLDRLAERVAERDKTSRKLRRR